MASTDVLFPAETGSEIPSIRTLHNRDLRMALEGGWADFKAMPTHVVFLCAFYPLVGLLLASGFAKFDLLPLLFPLASGFALIGPIAAIGLYELSRRRSAGLDTSWVHVFDIFRSPSLGPMAGLAGLLLALFIIWIITAQSLYSMTFGDTPVTTSYEFLKGLSTPAGHFLIITGVSVGAVFGFVAASISVIAMPMLLDRRVGLATAVATSLRVVSHNPRTMLTWFVVVAGCLAIGSIPLFMGLVVVLPVLGHATWHLYQRAVEPATGLRPAFVQPERAPRYGAQFPASLFARETSVAKRDKGSQQ
jgi:uncharacterized membrane protein